MTNFSGKPSRKNSSKRAIRSREAARQTRATQFDTPLTTRERGRLLDMFCRTMLPQ